MVGVPRDDEGRDDVPIASPRGDVGLPEAAPDLRALRVVEGDFLIQRDASEEVRGGDGHPLFDRVKRIVKLVGFVNATAAFTDHPKVINGASDFMVEVFGDKGRHARSAVASPSLPFGISTEVEAIVEIE